jgi:hypothetical protein
LWDVEGHSRFDIPLQGMSATVKYHKLNATHKAKIESACFFLQHIIESLPSAR